jgi:hypothetical protein
MELVEIGLAGYYRTKWSAIDVASFFRFYVDGYWINCESFDCAFDFPAYLASLDLVFLREHFPNGSCILGEVASSAITDWCRSWCGRYQRKANLDVLRDEGKHTSEMLELSSWNEARDRFTIRILRLAVSD